MQTISKSLVMIKLVSIVVILQLAQSWKLTRHVDSGRQLKRLIASTITGSMLPFITYNQIDVNMFPMSFIRPPYVSADSRLNAPSAAGTRVNSDPESLLRYGLPIKIKVIKDMQDSLESAKMNLITRRVIYAKNDMNNVNLILNANKLKILKNTPSNHVAAVQVAIDGMNAKFPTFEDLCNKVVSSGSGSIQEQAYLNDANLLYRDIASDMSTLMEQQVPDTFRRSIPSEYNHLPRLQGRATVNVVFKKPDGSRFDVDGVLYDDIKMKLVVDGYNAPLTAGNFVDLINKKFYDNKPVYIEFNYCALAMRLTPLFALR